MGRAGCRGRARASADRPFWLKQLEHLGTAKATSPSSQRWLVTPRVGGAGCSVMGPEKGYCVLCGGLETGLSGVRRRLTL